MDKILKKGMKPVSFIFLGLFVFVFAVALVFMTNYYWIVEADAIGKEVYKSLQGINDMLLYTGVVGIVAFALFALVSSTSRNYYYKSNLIVNIVGSCAAAVMSIVTLVLVIRVLPDFSSNFKEFQEITTVLSDGDLEITYTGITLALVSLILSILGAIAYVLFTIFKYRDSSKALKLKEKVVENNAE